MLRADRQPLTAETDKPLSRCKWTKKSTIRGTVVLTGATPLPRHQPQKSSHFTWYNREGDVRTQPDISTADPREKPDFRRDAGESPRVKVQRVDAVVEPVEVGLLQQLVSSWKHHWWVGQWKEKVCEPLLLWPEGGDQSHEEIGGLSDSSHQPFLPEERVETHKGPGCPKDDGTHPRRLPGDPGQGNSIGEA